MRTVTLDVRPLADTLTDFVQAWKTGKASSPRISFESPALHFKVLTGKRWELRRNWCDPPIPRASPPRRFREARYRPVPGHG